VFDNGIKYCEVIYGRMQKDEELGIYCGDKGEEVRSLKEQKDVAE
jgi:hypothetical protein